MKVRFLRNTSVGGVSHAIGEEADLNAADTHSVISIGRAEYVDPEDDPKRTSEPEPNPSRIPDLQRSLHPEIRKAVEGAMGDALSIHPEKPIGQHGYTPNPAPGQGTDPDADPHNLGEAAQDPTTDPKRSADRQRDPGEYHLDPTKGPAGPQDVHTREPRVSTRDPQPAPRGGAEAAVSRQTGAGDASRVGHEGTRPAPAGSAEAAVKHQTSSSSASGSHPSGGKSHK